MNVPDDRLPDAFEFAEWQRNLLDDLTARMADDPDFRLVIDMPRQHGHRLDEDLARALGVKIV